MKIRKTISAFFAISGLVLLAACDGGGPSKTVDPNDYFVGDTGPAGGIIFYVGTSYALEAAPADASTSQAWSNVTSATVATSTAIGSGLSNTNAIVTQSGHTVSAAQVCLDYSVTYNGKVYDDWFLPSKLELDEMYTNLHNNSLGNFASSLYWSSCCDSDLSLYASSKDFGTGSTQNSQKTQQYNVRAIRFIF